MLPTTLAVEHRSYDAERLVHRHDFRQVVFPERGRLELTVADRAGYVGGSQLAVVEPGTDHACWATTPTQCLIVEIRADLSESPRATTPFRLLDDRLALIAQALRVELATGGLRDRLIAESLATYLSASLASPLASSPNPSPTSAQRRLASLARDYIDAHLRDDLPIAEIATAVCASPSHLQRSFRAATGISVVRYVHQSRLHNACTLLRTPDLSITEIALAVGFADPNYFTRLFRRHFGVTPAKYRASP